MVDLSGHEAGNGGYSQRKPTAHRDSSTRKLVIWPVFNRCTILAVKEAGLGAIQPAESLVSPPKLPRTKKELPHSGTTVPPLQAALAGSLVALRIARDMEYTEDSWKQIWNKTRTSSVIGY